MSRKPDDFYSHNSLKISIANIGGSFFGCEPFLESNFPGILLL